MSKISSSSTFVLLLCINLCVVAARLLTMAKHHATLLFVVESITGSIKRVETLRAFHRPLGIICTTQVIVLLLIISVLSIKQTMNLICL